jgi:predicted RNA-binding Zn-ribbon protein involved in translation (DUF1610 family)
MLGRWKTDRPHARTAFMKRFPDDAACAGFLFEKRWPNGFVCPACGGLKAWELTTKRSTYECAACGRHVFRLATMTPYRGDRRPKLTP